MTRRLLLPLVLLATFAAGVAVVLAVPGLRDRVLALWPYSSHERARRAVAAIDAHDAATLGALVRSAEDANLGTADGETLLLHAIAAKDVSAVGLLLTRGADPERAGSVGRPPAARAAELRLLPVVRMLVARGARVREVPGRPLLVAIPSITPDELRTLIEAGANPYAVGEGGASAFRAAAADERPERLRIILQAPLPPDPDARREALGAAVASGRLENVKLLLAAGADPKEGDRTLAWQAVVSRASVDLLRALLDAGADPDAHPPQGAAPVVEAAQRGLLEPAQALLARPGKRAGLDRALAAAIAAGFTQLAGVLHAAGAPLPDDPAVRREVEHALSRAALGPNPKLADLRKPAAAAWDGPLLVGTTLLEKCQATGRDRPVPARWTDVDLPVSSLGRAEGDEVQALLAGGKAVPARLGKVSCMPSRCGQGWYGVALQGAPARDVLVLAPKGFVPAGARVSAFRRGAGTCAPPIPPAPAGGKWEKRCTSWSAGRVGVEVLEYAAGAGSTPDAVVHARLVGPRPLGPWLELGHKPGLAPALAVEAPNGPARLLFRRPGGTAAGEGLACVARADAGGHLELGRCYAAGGPGCN